MDNAKQHWKILQELRTDLENKVREFMVIGCRGDGVIVATEDGPGYWLGEMRFGSESKEAMEPTPLDIPNLSSMAQSYKHILLLTKSGQIYAMGQNDRGQLGLGNFDDETRFSPQLIAIPHKFTSVRCGYEYSLALTKDGKVWGWGNNDYGQVGVPCSTVSLPSPRQISDLNPHRVVAIECGGFHLLALTNQGKVYGWGLNLYGQLGVVSCPFTHTPTRIVTPSPVKSMAAGDSHTLLLTQTGEVYSCGQNEYGQLGIPTTTESSPSLSKVAGLPPILQIASHPLTNLSIAMSPDQRCFVWGQLAYEATISTPRELPPHYSTVESPLSFFSIYRNTPHSVSLPARKCHSKPATTTQTKPYFDSVLDQTMASLNRVLERILKNPDFLFLELCLSRMRTTLSPATCCLYYPLTYRHSQLPELSVFQQELVQFISIRTSEVYRTAAYQSMDAELCKKLSISIDTCMLRADLECQLGDRLQLLIN